MTDRLYKGVYLNTVNVIFYELMWLVPADYAQIPTCTVRLWYALTLRLMQ